MTNDGKKAFLLRVDARLWNGIQAWADQEFRSVNAQIEYLLREALARRRSAGRRDPGEGGAAAPRAEGE